MNKDIILRIMFELASGLAYTHSKKVCHGDLKPDNVHLLNSEIDAGARNARVKISDFGLSDLRKT